MRLIDKFREIFGGYHTGGLVCRPINTPAMGEVVSEQTVPHYDSRLPKARFINTHRHVATGKYYRVTGVGRLEVTGDEAYPLVEYENEAGERFAQRADRFFDGRFQAVLL